MKKLIARGAGMVAVGLTAASVAMFGAGAASADMSGQTYEDVSAEIAESNGTAIVAARNGDQLPLEECIVVSYSKSPTIDALTEDGNNDYLLNLNCNANVAQPGKPGNSVMSPVGKAAKADIDTAGRINENPEWCGKADENMEYCQKICERTELCEIS